MGIARDYLQKAEREMSACNCSEENKIENIFITKEREKERKELKETTDKFNNLRVKEQSLTDENISLKKEVEKLKRKKLRSREEKLEELILQLDIDEENKEKLEELHRAYEQKDEESIRAIKKDL